jgi:isoaspartyl peptidase/L-asparaginase-like protein (Ntn-hydrolase superfamily)
VAALTGVRHPVLAARAVMEEGRHVFLAGPGAAAFARQAGLAFETPEWFVTDRRRRDLADLAAGLSPPPGGSTVGAVARDSSGHLAAATSTGGRTGQHPGRIGDSPVPGSGTWADDATCAVSATGAGEAFLRAAFAHEIDARLRFGGADLAAACREALATVTALGGDGGCIAVAGEGPPVMPFTTALMHRGWAEVEGPLWVAARPGPAEPID